MEKGPGDEDGDVSSATIVAETIPCGIASNGRRLRKSSVPLGETNNPAPFTHTDGPLGWDSWIDTRRQRGRQQGLSSWAQANRGGHRVGRKRGRLVRCRNNYLKEMPPMEISIYHMVV